MVAPSYIDAGAAGDASGVAITPGYPATILADDLLLMHVWNRDPSAGTLTDPTDWVTVFGPDVSTNSTMWILAKKATGSESGTVTVDIPSTGSNTFVARIYQFRDWLKDATWANNWEGGGLLNSVDTGDATNITHTAVTTTDVDRLAVAFVAVVDDNALDAFTGETGGDWTEPVAEYTTITGTDGAIGLQVATLATAATLTGGSDAMAAADPWQVRTFAIKPASGAPANKRRYTLTTTGVG